MSTQIYWDNYSELSKAIFMSIKVNSRGPGRALIQRRMLAPAVSEEKRQLLDRLRGRGLNTLTAVEAAEKAFTQMRDQGQIGTADFPLIRQLISEPPDDRWADYYWSTESMSGYDGPFGSAIFSFDGWKFDRREAEIEEKEREADAPVIRRREELIGGIKTYLLHNLQSGLKLDLSVSAPRTMYENEVAWSYQIRARK